MYRADGAWQKILDEVIVKDDSIGELLLGLEKGGCTPAVDALAVKGKDSAGPGAG